MQLVGGDHIYNLPVLRGVGSGHFTSVAEKELSFYPCYEAVMTKLPRCYVARTAPFRREPALAKKEVAIFVEFDYD